MENKKKFSKANLLYVFSMVLGVVIIVLGFTVANSAKTELEKNSEKIKVEEQLEKEVDIKTVSKPAEKIEKEEETVVIKIPEKIQKEDEFAPNLENYTLTPPTQGNISVSFTGTSLVYSKQFDEWAIHKGVHISAKESAQVKAVANGKVESVYTDNREGLTIVLKHGDFTTTYANLSTEKLVKVGDSVYAGDIISGVGKSPSGEEYLHFEICYKGQDIDPEPLIIR